MNQINLAKNLIHLRKEKGVTKKWMSEELLGVHESTYGNYELGKRAPDYETLVKLADYFNCTTDYLLGRVDEPNLVHYDTGVDYEGDRVYIDVVKDALDKGFTREDIDEFIQMGIMWREMREKNKKPK